MKEANKNRKEEVLSHHSEVNIDEIWAAIEPQVDIINAEKKRKKRFAFFFLFGAILLASGGILYLWQNSDTVDTDNFTVKTEAKKTETKTEEAFDWSSSEDLNNKELQSADLTNKAVDIAFDKSVNKGIENNKTKQKIASSKLNEAINNKNTSVKKTIFTNPINTANHTPYNNQNQSQQINTSTPLATIITPKNSEPLLPEPYSPSPTISSRDLKLSSLIPDVGEADIKPPSQLPGGKLSFAVAANTGISFINRGLASNIEGEPNPDVLRLRRESETLLEAIHYGLRTKLTHKSGFSFSTGAQYTILSERYDNNNLEVESDSIQGIIKREVQLNGDTIDIVGMLPRTTTYDYEKQIYNRYKMIDIPFIVGFEGGVKEWSVGVQAGVFLNLALNTSGQIRSTATEDINIADKQSEVFKNKLGLSYYGGIYIRRALSQNLDITIAPHGRFFAQDFNVENYAVRQRYSLIGIQAGLSYRFGY